MVMGILNLSTDSFSGDGLLAGCTYQLITYQILLS